jgi:localization factor PodJL
MTSRRNVFDGLNANRTRRGASALDDLERTLNGLEARVGNIAPRPEPAPQLAPLARRDDYAERFQQLGVQFSQRDDRVAYAPPAYARPSAPAPSHSLSRLAQDIEQARREEENFNGLNAVSAEINRLRADIRTLTERPADKSGELLRREIEELKRHIGLLAREDTLRSVGRSWEAYEQRPLDSDPAFEKLAGRLEEIQSAVDGLPQSLSLQSLEEKVRVLATALDGLSRQNPGVSAEHLEVIEARLDEISRAIVASSVAAPAMSFDHTPFDRIEARLSSLSERVDLIASDDSAQMLAEHMAARIAGLTERFDDMARSAAMPEEQIVRLAGQIDAISRKISEKPAEPNADVLMQGLENRLYEIASAIDKKSRDATDQTLGYFRDLEGRLQELTQRIEDSESAPAQQNPEILELINSRFADFYHKVDEKQKKSAGQSVDPGIIRDLEAQVKNLSLQLDRPAAPIAEYEDISPRLFAIETSLSANREALLDAARKAAEDAIRNMALPQANAGEREAVLDLANDLKSLEAMARKADDRNSRTFEAIHDTLLKIVDRLSTIEVDGASPVLSPARAGALASSTVIPARSFDFGSDIPALEPEERAFAPEIREPVRTVTRSPAAAAAAAAAAAEDRRAAQAEPAAKTSIFDGIARAVRGEAKAEAKLAGDPAPSMPKVSPFEGIEANQPLEPGSGAPDLNSIMKRVREERQSRSDAGGDNVVKSDLIAAARRAAQAAAAEAEILKKASGKADPAQKSGIADLVSRQRKPLFMAIGAVIVALAGLQLGKAYFSGEPVTLKAEAPVIIDEKAKIEEKAQAEPAIDTIEPSKADIASADSSVRVIDKPAKAGDAMMAAPKAEDLPAMSMDKPLADGPAASVPASASADAKPSDAPMASGGAAKAPDEMAPAASAKPAMNAELPPVDAGPIALREAAAGGDAKALFEIASRYADGRGVEKNLKAAAKYYTRAADTGFAPAQFRIGSFYEKGLGVERDAGKAKTWYQMAAEQGNASAMHNLAVLFAMGASGPVDNDSAANWFTKAAEFGVKDSQYNLGILAAKGLGVKQNLEDSYKWFALAAKAGDKDAASKRDEIANAMRPEQLAKARAAADLWKAKDAEPAVNTVEIPDSWKESAGQTASVGEPPVNMKKAIRNIQLILAKNGYDAGAPDGVMGGKTTKAIAAYQAANGMKSTGEVDEALVRSLLAKAK